MIIRLGFVSTAMAIYNNTPSSTFTYKLFSERPRDEAMQRAIEIGRKTSKLRSGFSITMPLTAFVCFDCRLH